MVFQAFDNTAPGFFGAADPLSILASLTVFSGHANETGDCAVHRVLRGLVNSACKEGITVYHQTHQR
jgi:hypothetical protein